MWNNQKISCITALNAVIYKHGHSATAQTAPRVIRGKEIKMFKRVVIFTSFTGLEKVSRTEKRHLAKIINSEVSIINEDLRAKDTNASLDGKYRAFLFNDDAPAMAEFLAKLKAFAENTAGINVYAWEIEEVEYARLPVKRRDFLAASSGKEIFKI